MIQFFFFRSIPDIIVAYCIYVDMKVIAMKANIRSSNNNQIYGKVIYVYQIIILYKAFCVTVSTNFDTYIWGLEIEISDVVGYSKIIFFALFKF